MEAVGQPWSPLQKAGRAGAARPAKMEEGEKECKVQSYVREVGLWSGAGYVCFSQPHTLPSSLTHTCVNSWYIIQIHCNGISISLTQPCEICTVNKT